MMAEKCPALAGSCSLSFSHDLVLIPGLKPLELLAEKCQILACSCSQVAALALSSQELDFEFMLWNTFLFFFVVIILVLAYQRREGERLA